MIEVMSQWIKRIPGRVWVAVGCLLVGALWLAQHDAHIRQQARLQQARQQASAQVAALKKQAEQDAEKANVENAKAIAELEARRQQIEQQNQALAAQLAALRKQEQIQAGQVAALPTSEVVTRVATQLGLQAADVLNGSQGAGVGAVGSSAHIAQNSMPAPAAEKKWQKGSSSRARFLTALGMTLLSGGSSHTTKNATPAPPADAVATSKTSGGEDTAAPAPPALALTASGARKVETALVELSACRAEGNVQSQQLSNCQARAAADDAEIQRLNGSVASLNQALQAKDKILNEQASECNAELRAAKGTFWGRLVRTAKRVAIGVALGVAIGVAAR